MRDFPLIFGAFLLKKQRWCFDEDRAREFATLPARQGRPTFDQADMKQQHQDPRAICEQMLAITGKALMTGNFELFAGCFAYPQELQTFLGCRILHDKDDLRSVFDEVRTFYMKHGVTELVRYCVEAELKDPDTVQAVHETRLISGSTIVQAAFPVFSRIVRIDGSWKVLGTTYALTGDDPAIEDFLSRLTDMPSHPVPITSQATN